MAKADLCPVCQGSGKVYEPPPEGLTVTTGNYRTCHGCGGKGWVEVADSPIREPWYYPQWHHPKDAMTF